MDVLKFLYDSEAFSSYFYIWFAFFVLIWELRDDGVVKILHLRLIKNFDISNVGYWQSI